MIYGTHPKFGSYDEAYKSFRDLDLVVESARRSLKPVADTFDSIVVTGVSGLSVGAPLALALKKNLLVLRKPSEDCHDNGDNGPLLGAQDLDETSRVLIVDDMISQGTTCGKLYDAVLAACPEASVVGAYLYEYDRLYESAELVNRIGR